MRNKRYLVVVSIVAVFGLVAAACGGDGGPTATSPAGPDKPKGGVYRVQADSDFGFNGGFDPSGEYLGFAWGIYSNLLLRNLVTYPHVSGAAGNELVPDLATEIPEPSEDGLVYEFTLKDGIEFGPPVNREIVAEDFVTAFERIGTESVTAQYGFYYNGIIAGLTEFGAGDADTISGVEAVDEKTLRLTLTAPTGDILFRLAMPATSPFPAEVSDCWVNAAEYGRYLIASGPYMIEGSDELDATSCDTMQPISGFDPAERLSLVRNPNYDEATDDPAVRESNPDGFLYTINTNNQDIFDKIAAGEVEGEVAGPPPQVIQEYSTNPDLADFFQVFSGDRTWYVTMNLTLPPFDDINVRKAVNAAIDKESLRRLRGGPTAGDIATHIVPPSMTGETPTNEEYDPYPSEGFAGDIAAAQEFMRQSAYDSDGDGVCDDPVCQDILFLTRNTPPQVDQAPVVEENLAPLGMTFTIRELDTGTAYAQLADIARQFPIAINAGWGKDYGDPSTFMVLFDGRNISCAAGANSNYALVGLTPEMAEECGIADEPERAGIDAVPNVDAGIDECTALVDQERLDCWIELDKELMENVVPWAPMLWATNIDVLGPAVVGYDFDQFSGEAAYSKVAVDTSAQTGEGV